MLKPSGDPDLLVGYETSDDAAVYRLTPDLAFISTVDFITPPVDDPYWFGQIAAANSLSDVYAMGGKPLTALNLIMYPLQKLPIDSLKQVLRGGYDKVIESGASMAGGHSVDDNEPKYGLAVTGVVHPDKILTNCRAQDGDALILTKPLGTGVLFNACRSGKLPFKELEKILPSVASISDKALGAALKFDVNACTDVTGFGIAGHVLEMAIGSCVTITLLYHELPVYSHALEMYRKGETTGSNKANRKLVEGFLDIKRNLSKEEKELLFDPQTSGGLLFSVPAEQADQLIRELRTSGVEAARRIGEVKKSPKPSVQIR